MASEIRQSTKTTKASTLVHSVTTISKTWQRRAWDIRGIVKRLTELFAAMLLRGLVRVCIGRTLGIVRGRNARASRSLLVGGLQKARSESASVVRGHAKGSKSKVTIASIRAAWGVEATEPLMSVRRGEIGASSQRGTSRWAIVLVRLLRESSRHVVPLLGSPRFVLVDLGQVGNAGLVLESLGTNIFVAVL
jgi:hypothetical protein